MDEKKLRIGENLANSLNMNFDFVPAVGSYGGLTSCWDPSTWLDKSFAYYVTSVDDFFRDLVNIKLVFKKQIRRHESWTPPTPGILKINVNGAAIGCPGPCGIGSILRNSKNEIKGFFSKNIGIGFSFEAEVLPFLRP